VESNSPNSVKRFRKLEESGYSTIIDAAARKAEKRLAGVAKRAEPMFYLRDPLIFKGTHKRLK
jgi:hypothetical protein